VLAIASILLPLLGAWTRVSIAQDSAQSEAKLKAAYLFNFAKFVEWPADAFADSDSPVVFGTIGRDVLGSALAEAIHGKTVGGRRVVARTLSSSEDPRQCHLLFIGPMERGRISQLMTALNGSSVLTVGDADGFLRIGGIIKFVIVNDRLQFEINVSAARRSRIKISSKLMQLSRTPSN